MANQKKHAVYFDGTTHFVESTSFEIDDDTVQVFSSNSIEECEEKADELNDLISFI